MDIYVILLTILGVILVVATADLIAITKSKKKHKHLEESLLERILDNYQAARKYAKDLVEGSVISRIKVLEDARKYSTENNEQEAINTDLKARIELFEKAAFPEQIKRTDARIAEVDENLGKALQLFSTEMGELATKINELEKAKTTPIDPTGTISNTMSIVAKRELNIKEFAEKVFILIEQLEIGKKYKQYMESSLDELPADKTEIYFGDFLLYQIFEDRYERAGMVYVLKKLSEDVFYDV